MSKKPTEQANNPESIEWNLDALLQQKPITFSGHKWRQRGPMLVCTSCEVGHGTFIGMNKKFAGIDENGNPVFMKVDIS